MTKKRRGSSSGLQYAEDEQDRIFSRRTVTPDSIIRAAFDTCDEERTNEISISDAVFLFRSLFGMRVSSKDIKHAVFVDSTVSEGSRHYVPPPDDESSKQQKLSYNVFCSIIPEDAIKKLEENNGNTFINELYEVIVPRNASPTKKSRSSNSISIAHVMQLVKEVEDDETTIDDETCQQMIQEFSTSRSNDGRNISSKTRTKMTSKDFHNMMQIALS